MKLFSYTSLIFFGFLFLCACESNVAMKNQEDIHFNLMSFTDSLVSKLESNPKTFSYSLTVNTEKESVEKKDLDWKKEIAFLKQADINKPILKGAYLIEETKNGTREQLKYVANSEKEKVRQLIIFKENNKVKRIEAEIFEDLQLFSSSKNFWIELDDSQTLKAYYLESKEEILFIGDKLFTVSAKRL